MSNPALILLDEVSLGLAPVVVRDVYRALPSITAGGTTAVIVEQDISIALDVADEVYCLLGGSGCPPWSSRASSPATTSPRPTSGCRA